MVASISNWGFILSGVQMDWKVLVITLLVIIPLTTRLITTIRCSIGLRQEGTSKIPPTVPYTIPWLAHTVSFGFDILNFSTNVRKSFGTSPARLVVANQNLRFLSGSEQVLAFFKASRDATTTPMVIQVLEVGFGTPTRFRHLFNRDTTGLYHVPFEGSKALEPHNRIHHNLHKILHTNMSGTGLAELGLRFMTFLEKELNLLDIDDEWSQVDDFYAMVQKVAFKASVTAIFGPHLLRLNPTFVDDYWLYDEGVPSLIKSFPRWVRPKPYAYRDKLLQQFAVWHTYANEHFNWGDKDLAKEEWEEFYGSKLVRERTKMYKAIDGMEDEWRYSNDLGLLFGATSNLVPLISWEILDTVTRPDVLTKCREEISKTIDPSSAAPLGIQTTKLFNNPFILSVYTEEMRLRFAAWLQRTPTSNNYQINGWKFPKNETVLVSIWNEHRDKSVWNEGPVKGDFHSVEDFWAERFLVYPDDPASGPRKPGSSFKTRTTPVVGSVGENNEPKFTTESVAGSLIPYGGGSNICPGRFFAKQEAVLGLAMFITMFDIEIVGDYELKPNMHYFPFGMLPPSGKLRARMRRRKQI